MTKITSLFAWQGGKFYQLNWLLPKIPKHNHYVDLFGGSGVIILNKPKSNVETYNDLHGGLTNMFRVMQSDSGLQALLRKFRYPFHSRIEFNRCRKWESEPDNVEMAYMFLYTALFCLSGTAANVLARFGCLGNSTEPVLPIDIYAKIEAFANRFRGVCIENSDAATLIDRLDAVDTFFLTDPPYLECNGGDVYKCQFPESKHVELLERLVAIKGKAMVFGFENELYSKYLGNWYKYTREKRKGYQTQKAKSRAETMWLNYLPENEFLFE